MKTAVVLPLSVLVACAPADETGLDAGTTADAGVGADVGSPADSGSEDAAAVPLTLPATLTTGEFPNGLAVTDEHLFVAIGGRHASADVWPTQAGQKSVVQVFSIVDGSLVTEIEVASGGHSLRMTPDGSKLYLAHFSLDNQVTVISTAGLEVLATIGGGLQADIVVPDALAISNDGRYVYVGSNGLSSGWISRIDAMTDTVDPSFRIPVDGGYTCWVELGVDPDVLYANSWSGGTVQRKAISSGRAAGSAQVGAFPHALVIEPSGDYVYALVSGGNEVVKLEADSLTEVTKVLGPWAGNWGGPVSGTLSKSGRSAFIANHGLAAIAVIDIDPSSATYDTVIATFEVGLDPIFSVLSPDGDRLYVGNNESATVTVLDVSAIP